SFGVAPRRCARSRPIARSSSTSCAACQKNKYGEIVVPRIATRTEKNPRDHSMCGMTVASSARRQSTRATNAVRTYARSTSVSHLNTRAIVRYDDHINSTIITAPKTGTISVTGAPLTIIVASAIPPSCLHGHSAASGASCRFTSTYGPQCPRGELSGVGERLMIIPMTTTGRLQQRYDHRLRDLVQGTEDVTIATNLGVPRSTARGWLGKAPKVVVSLDVTNLKASELQQEVLELRRRVKKLTALLRLALALRRSSRFTLR